VVIPAMAQDSLAISRTLLEVPDSVFVVGKVIINGNLHTKDFVITREMSLKTGTRITQELLRYDERRVYSLGLFNQVQLRVLPFVDSLAAVIVNVSERWYVFPFPIFGIKDRDWSKVYYGVGILHNNFRGRNEKVYTTLVFGYDPAARTTYRNPFLSEDGTDFFEGSLSYNKVRNRSLLAQIGNNNYDERHFSTTLILGKRIGIEHTLAVSIGYELVDISDVTPVKTLSPDGKDQFPVFSAGYSYDTRDLREYANSGTYARATITKYGFPSNVVDIVRYSGEVRKHIPLLSNLVLVGKTFTDLVAAGPTPPYNRVYFGYGERIRGHFKEVMEGENIFGVSSEVRYTLMAPEYFRVGAFPEEFGVWRFGVTLTAFADAGTVWFRGQPFALDQFTKGYGVGLNFLLPYSLIVRTEYAWNESRRGEFIIDVGTLL
jgi:outer membrane protein assembly factor BamA